MTVSRRKASATRILSLGSSLGTLAAALWLAAPAFAQEPPKPQTPNANTTGVAESEVTKVPPADPTPDAAANPDPTAEPADGEGDVVVTGIRASLAKSAAIKRDSTLIVDSVSAEDVGKLPDVSIADALARLPGVTAQRVEGRDQNLSIRGLGPDFSTTLLNGREQVTTGDNRGVEFDQYPSEFFRNVNIYKSADASLIAAGISGTVDLRMLRPLDATQPTLVVAARGQLNEKKKLNPEGTRVGYRASATYVDQFADDTLGIALGFSATRTPTQDERYNAWGYADDGANLVLGGAKPYVQSNKLDRIGGVATIEYRPSENWHSTFDALYSHFEDEQYRRGIEFPLGFAQLTGGTANGTVISSRTVEDGFDTVATFQNVYGVQRNDYNKRDADTLSLGWNNDFLLTDTIHFNVDASWSRAKRTDFLLETYSGTGYNKSGRPDTVTATQQNDGTFTFQTALNYADTGIFQITDPQGWGGSSRGPVVQAGYYNRPKFTDDLKSLRASFNGEFEGSVVHSWEAGGNYSRRKKDNDSTNFFLCPPGGGTQCLVATGTPTSAAVPTDAIKRKTVSLDYLGIPQMLTVNPKYLLDNFYQQVLNDNPGELGRRYKVTEDVWTGYAKIGLDGEVGGKALKGSIGVQAIYTRQKSDGVQASLNNAVVTVLPISGKDDYWRILPSATMSVELIPSGYVKLGASQTMIRPRLDQEKVTQVFGINLANVGQGSDPFRSPFSQSGGNINLKPYQSTNIDVSLEKYFQGGGYLALTGYYKHLTDYINPSVGLAQDFSTALALLTPEQRATVVSQNAAIGLFTRPENNGRGEIMGVEATASAPFKMFTSFLDGFGVFATGTFTDSTVKYGGTPMAITVPGLSRWVGSATAYFEKWGFQARANYRYRSKFLGEIQGLSADPTLVQAGSEEIVDAQIGYEFQSGFLRGLAILAQGKNLTDRPFFTYYNNDKRQVRDYQSYGRDYYVGITYKVF